MTRERNTQTSRGRQRQHSHDRPPPQRRNCPRKQVVAPVRKKRRLDVGDPHAPSSQSCATPASRICQAPWAPLSRNTSSNFESGGRGVSPARCLRQSSFISHLPVPRFCLFSSALSPCRPGRQILSSPVVPVCRPHLKSLSSSHFDFQKEKAFLFLK